MCNPIALRDLPERQLALYFRGELKRSFTLARVGNEIRHYFNLRQSQPGIVKGSYEVRKDVALDATVHPLQEMLAETEVSRPPKEWHNAEAA